jgi:hypothetical protein
VTLLPCIQHPTPQVRSLDEDGNEAPTDYQEQFGALLLSKHEVVRVAVLLAAVHLTAVERKACGIVPS